jgi:hypothetical protein
VSFFFNSRLAVCRDFQTLKNSSYNHPIPLPLSIASVSAWRHFDKKVSHAICAAKGLVRLVEHNAGCD